MKTFTSKNIIKYLALSFLLTPISLYALATSESVFGGLGKLIESFNESVVQAVGAMMLTLAVVVFFFGIVQFIWAKREGNAGKVKVGQSFMAWGLIAIFVMFSVWGIVTFFGRSLGIDTGGTITVPSLNFKTDGTGGSSSSKKPVGSTCAVDPDCLSNYCSNISKTCQTPVYGD